MLRIIVYWNSGGEGLLPSEESGCEKMEIIKRLVCIGGWLREQETVGQRETVSNSLTELPHFLFSWGKEFLKDTQAAQEAYLVKMNKENPPRRQHNEFCVIEFLFHEYLWGRKHIHRERCPSSFPSYGRQYLPWGYFFSESLEKPTKVVVSKPWCKQIIFEDTNLLFSGHVWMSWCLSFGYSKNNLLVISRTFNY